MERKAKLQELKDFFYNHICEDHQDGTTFDCDFLDWLKVMEDKYAHKYQHGYVGRIAGTQLKIRVIQYLSDDTVEVQIDGTNIVTSVLETHIQ